MYAQGLADFALSRSELYQPGAPFLAEWGCDFFFADALPMFDKMRQVMRHVNANADRYGITTRYSTLSDFVDTTHALGLSYPKKRWPLDFEFGWPHEIKARHPPARATCGHPIRPSDAVRRAGSPPR